jgi:hypothetical protein
MFNRLRGVHLPDFLVLSYYYDLALDASPTFPPAREALVRLQRIEPKRD